MARIVELRTRFSVDQCLGVLRTSSQLPPRIRFTVPLKQTFYGTFSPPRFRLFVLGPDYIPNSFMPYFYGLLIPTSDGTILRGSLRRHPMVSVLFVLWCGWFFGILGFFLWAVVTGYGRFEVHPALAVLAVLCVWGMGVVVIRSGVRKGQPQEEALLKFVESILEAVESKEMRLANQRVSRIFASFFP